MCINSVKETCFSQKYQKWICLILELNSSIYFRSELNEWVAKIKDVLDNPRGSFPPTRIQSVPAPAATGGHREGVATQQKGATIGTEFRVSWLLSWIYLSFCNPLKKIQNNRRIQDFQIGCRKRLSARSTKYHKRDKRSPLYGRVQGPGSSRVLDTLSCYTGALYWSILIKTS